MLHFVWQNIKDQKSRKKSLLNVTCTENTRKTDHDIKIKRRLHYRIPSQKKDSLNTVNNFKDICAYHVP